MHGAAGALGAAARGAARLMAYELGRGDAPSRCTLPGVAMSPALSYTPSPKVRGKAFVYRSARARIVRGGRPA